MEGSCHCHKKETRITAITKKVQEDQEDAVMSLFRAKDESEFMFSSSLELLSLSLMFLPDASLAFLDP